MMLDLRRRTIAIKVNGEWYSIDFKPKFLGRVKDVSVWKSVENAPTGVFVPCDIETSHHDISTVEALVSIWREVKYDAIRFLQRLYRKKSTGKLHRKDQE